MIDLLEQHGIDTAHLTYDGRSASDVSADVSTASTLLDQVCMTVLLLVLVYCACDVVVCLLFLL